MKDTLNKFTTLENLFQEYLTPLETMLFFSTINNNNDPEFTTDTTLKQVIMMKRDRKLRILNDEKYLLLCELLMLKGYGPRVDKNVLYPIYEKYAECSGVVKGYKNVHENLADEFIIPKEMFSEKIMMKRKLLIVQEMRILAQYYLTATSVETYNVAGKMLFLEKALLLKGSKEYNLVMSS